MPGGRPCGSVKPKIMSDALILALNRAAADGKGKKLARVADALVKAAIEGDVTAIREIFDRVEGKAVQQQIITGDEDQPIVHKHILAFVSGI
jgi:hypothetical protein